VPIKKTLKIGIVAGEHSGDRLGAGIIQAFKSQNDIELFGVGGPKLVAQGLISEFDFNKLNVMGIIEPLFNFRELNNLRKKLIKLFKEKEINYFIGVDSPDFNMAIHKNMKATKTSKNIQLVSPSVWGWRENRIKSIEKYIDLTVCLFNFEHDFYNKKNLNSTHLGHPFSNLIPNEKLDVINKFNLDESKKFVAILPGSRKSEIKNILPTYIEFIRKHFEKYNDFNYLIPVADKSSKVLIEKEFFFYDLPIKIGINCSREFLSISDLSVVTSGTATLEAAVLGAEPIICYKTSKLNYFILSRMLKVSHIGLPNLLLNQRRFPELVQQEATSTKILKEVECIQNRQSESFIQEELRDLLHGEGNAKTAEKILLL
jgi:lipid-A-disaccharide synthase